MFRKMSAFKFHVKFTLGAYSKYSSNVSFGLIFRILQNVLGQFDDVA